MQSEKTKRRGGGCPGAAWRLAATAVMLGLAPGATANDFTLGEDLRGYFTATFNYAAAMRVEGADPKLIDGPIDPTTGLPTTANADDGNRNFESGSLVNNRASVLGEVSVRGENWGVLLRGDAFYDNAYIGRNDNDSPDTINKRGANDRFIDAAKSRQGRRLRLLDAYAYTDLELGATRLNLRAGQQVVAWGESLFFSGLASTQSPADATKANVAGTELESILLPVPQVAINWSLTPSLSLQAQYRFDFKATEVDPPGSYFSFSDIVGPGAEFLLAARLPDGSSMRASRGPDDRPSDHGQWGVGLGYQLTMTTSIGLHHVRYHNPNPAVVTDFSDPAAPNYSIAYFEGIDMTALSLSTYVGATSVAAEVSFRDGIDMLAGPQQAPVRGRVSQALVSALYTMSPNALSEQISLSGEVGYLRAHSLERGGLSQLAGDRSSWAVSGTATFNYRNIFPLWDLAVPVAYEAIVNGTPAVSGVFGSMVGEHDHRASISADFIYLQDLEVGLSYNAFLGSADLARRPLADRDYAAVNIKYTF